MPRTETTQDREIGKVVSGNKGYVTHTDVVVVRNDRVDDFISRGYEVIKADKAVDMTVVGKKIVEEEIEEKINEHKEHKKHKR